MALKIIHTENGRITFQFENVISPWNIMKYLLDVPYLKRFVIDKYDGGNMLVPREAWKEEGVMFKEIKPGIYLFPYESIGFVLDDSIHNLKLYIMDNYTEGSNYKDHAEMVFSVIDTDTANLTADIKNVPLFMALYLLSISRLGFDTDFLKSLESVMESSFPGYSYPESIEYMPTSVMIGLKKISFNIRMTDRHGAETFHKISYSGKKCRKEPLKEKNIRNILYLKKKILKKNKYYPLIFYGSIVVLTAAFFILNKKIFILLLVVAVVLRVIYVIVRKNAYKFVSK